MFNSIQQQEENDFQIGASSELQNAYAISCMSRDRSGQHKIDAYIRAGMFVVVGEMPEYCRSTDGLLPGSYRFPENFAPTREKAERLCEEAIRESEADGNHEIDFHVEPVVKLRNQKDYRPSNIPF